MEGTNTAANKVANTAGLAGLRDKLNLPEGYTPLHCVLLGYKDMEGKTAPRKENAVQYIR